jgi:hypothetical protein
MNDEPDKREGKNPKSNPRADRLKLALRENLKRRKSQARGRGEMTMTPRNDDDTLPDDEDGKKRNA